jgi:hypothetical protein
MPVIYHYNPKIKINSGMLIKKDILSCNQYHRGKSNNGENEST